ncbi:hypothetical protein GRZ55_11095 [Chelativorans sp. ZYF759]|uniref:glycoside hydrolase family protein n=1 Tax=Chelativorans sp. ZYF759 TaxID=2692213 RepID=UPI00145E7F06|nr:peptidoglycan-binding protein [Chelativorans sp. ZYF759]NMG39789.1 hypothetical protein [Chelativorans sp. ZYF759]
MSITRLSAAGEAVLVAEEGEVLRSYVCPAGVRTIGVGLTRASGVVDPKPGMTITREESRRLLHLALDRNYMPRVKRAGLDRRQGEFDGSTLFDFNTGRIHNASWVGHWLAGRAREAAQSFKSWTRGGGRVLPGLVRRRDVEWDMIEHGHYPAGKAAAAPASLSSHEDYRDALIRLGYDTTGAEGLAKAVRAFQRDHGLTVDAKIGPATRAAFKRALDLHAQNRAAGSGGAAGGVAGGGGEIATSGEATTETALWALGLGISAALIIIALFLVWRFRGPLFAWAPEGVKDWFEDRGIVIGRRVRT